MKQAGYSDEQMVRIRRAADQMPVGQVLKCSTDVDEHTRERLAIDVARRIRSGRVIDKLSQQVSVDGAPRYLRSDNGPARAVLKWLTDTFTKRNHRRYHAAPDYQYIDTNVLGFFINIKAIDT